MSRRLPRLAAPILATTLALLSGCGGSGGGLFGPGKDEFAPACPTATPLWQAADITRYRDETAQVHDIRDLVLSGHIVAMPAKCMAGDNKNQLAANVGVTIQLTRGPAMQGRAVDVPLFLAVAEGGRILDKQVFQTHDVFPDGVEQITLTGGPIHMVFPVTATKTGAAYTVIAGFQLTPQELAVNRAHDAP